MTTDIFSLVTSTLAESPWTPVAAYGLMIWIGGQTLGHVVASHRLARSAETLATFFRHTAGSGTDRDGPAQQAERLQQLTNGLCPGDIRRRSMRFLNESLLPLRHQLQRDEVIAPLCGLGFSMLAWALALPNADEMLRHDPQQMMRVLAIGASTSFLGVAIAAFAVVTGKRLDIVHDRLTAQIDELVQVELCKADWG